MLYLSMAVLWIVMVFSFWIWDATGNAPPQVVHMIWFAAFLAGYNLLRAALVLWPSRTRDDVATTPPPAPKVEVEQEPK